MQHVSFLKSSMKYRNNMLTLNNPLHFSVMQRIIAFQKENVITAFFHGYSAFVANTTDSSAGLYYNNIRKHRFLYYYNRKEFLS